MDDPGVYWRKSYSSKLSLLRKWVQNQRIRTLKSQNPKEADSLTLHLVRWPFRWVYNKHLILPLLEECLDAQTKWLSLRDPLLYWCHREPLGMKGEICSFWGLYWNKRIHPYGSEYTDIVNNGQGSGLIVVVINICYPYIVECETKVRQPERQGLVVELLHRVHCLQVMRRIVRIEELSAIVCSSVVHVGQSWAQSWVNEVKRRTRSCQ